MTDTERNEFASGMGTTHASRKMPMGLVIAGIVVVTVIAVVLMAFPGGGDHRTPHAPVNAAMTGSPSESDHTNTDADDQMGGFGKGVNSGMSADDNIEHVKGSTTAVPDTAAVK